jgi:hypothetical protein
MIARYYLQYLQNEIFEWRNEKDNKGKLAILKSEPFFINEITQQLKALCEENINGQSEEQFRQLTKIKGLIADFKKAIDEKEQLREKSTIDWRLCNAE